MPGLGHSRYQAVFLTNGQTYFGRYYDRIGAYAKIEDVYYLQQVKGSDPDAAPDTRIVRRGRELHEPASRMLIPKSAILFIEDLTDASPITGSDRKSTFADTSTPSSAGTAIQLSDQRSHRPAIRTRSRSGS